MCICDPTRGQECQWCNGFAAEAGITPPAPDLPTVEQWSAAQHAVDPWLDPHAALTAPF